MRRGRRQARPLPARLLAGLVVAAALLFLGEGIARQVGPLVPQWQARDSGGVIMVGHPTRLWGMATGERLNAGTKATIGDNGLRGTPPQLPRPAGRERILLVGDSSFFGHGVADDQTPTERLRARLRSEGLDVDVVNAAIPGYSTEQSRLLLDDLGWAMEPTLLVIANVWSDYNFDHFRDADLLRTQRLFGDNPLAGSALFQLLAGTVDRLRGGRGAHVVTWTRHSDLPRAGTRRVPLQDYAANLDRMIRDARAHGAGALLLQPSNREMAAGDASDEANRAPYFGAQDAVAAWHGIPVARTLAAFRAAAGTAGVEALFLDDLHPTAEGDDLVAQVLQERLREAGWPQERLLGRDEAFDASGLVDPVGEVTVGEGSPQVNLFPRAGAPADANTPGWRMEASVLGPPGRATVEVKTLAGVVISSEDAAVPGTVTVDVGPGNPQVVVSARGPSGRVEAEAAADRGAVELRLPN